MAFSLTKTIQRSRGTPISGKPTPVRAETVSDNRGASPTWVDVRVSSELRFQVISNTFKYHVLLPVKSWQQHFLTRIVPVLSGFYHYLTLFYHCFLAASPCFSPFCGRTYTCLKRAFPEATSEIFVLCTWMWLVGSRRRNWTRSCIMLYQWGFPESWGVPPNHP